MSLEEGTAYVSPLRPQRVGGSRVTARRGLENWGWSGGQGQTGDHKDNLDFYFQSGEKPLQGLEKGINVV